MPFDCAACQSPFAPLEDSLRPGERPTSGSDKGTYGELYPCKRKSHNFPHHHLQTQDFIVVHYVICSSGLAAHTFLLRWVTQADRLFRKILFHNDLQLSVTTTRLGGTLRRAEPDARFANETSGSTWERLLPSLESQHC